MKEGRKNINLCYVFYFKFNREASAGVDPKFKGGSLIDTGVTNDESSFTMGVRTYF